MATSAQPAQMDLVWIPAEGFNVVSDPLESQPAVFETVIPADVRLCRSEEAKNGEPVVRTDGHASHR